MRKNWVHKARIECCGKGTIKEITSEYEKYIYGQLKIQKKSKKIKLRKCFRKQNKSKNWKQSEKR